MPDGDIFNYSLHGGWKRTYRAFLGRQPIGHKIACVSQAIHISMGTGNTGKAVGIAVSVLEATLKNQQQGVLEFDHSPEVPLHSFERRIADALTECGGGKLATLVKEVSASVFVQCQDAYVLDGAIGKLFAEELTRRLIASQCLDNESVKQKLFEAKVVSDAKHDAWIDAEFESLYPHLREQMETFVASHGVQSPKKLVFVPAESVNSFSYLTQPLEVTPLLDESAK